MKIYLQLSLLSLFVACSGSDLTDAERFVRTLNNNSFYYDYVLVKDPARRTDHIVVERSDGEFFAIDIYEYYTEYANDYEYFVDERLSVEYIGNSYYEDRWGNLYQESSMTPKDLETVGAFMENIRVQEIGNAMAENYGLSESRGLEIARLAMEWQQVSKSRSLTDKDANAFSEKILGFNLTTAKDAYKKSLQGSEKGFQELINKAAEVNNTTPEHMNELISSFIK